MDGNGHLPNSIQIFGLLGRVLRRIKRRGDSDSSQVNVHQDTVQQIGIGGLMKGRIVNVFSEFETSDFALAALLSCDKYPLVKCVTNGNNESTSWTFRIPSCDCEIYLELVAKEDTQVPLLGFVQGLKTIQQAQAQARQNHGEWISPHYARVGAA